VRKKVIGSGTMSVLFVWRDVNSFARMDFHRNFAALLHSSDPMSRVENLTHRMRMPGGLGTRFKGDEVDAHK
jgi:hypothetical protein